MIGNIVSDSSNVYDNLNNKIISTYNTHTDKLIKEIENTILTCEEVKIDAKKRFTSYYNRKTFIDYLIYLNLLATPILAAILIYIEFIKK